MVVVVVLLLIGLFVVKTIEPFQSKQNTTFLLNIMVVSTKNSQTHFEFYVMNKQAIKCTSFKCFDVQSVFK